MSERFIMCIDNKSYPRDLALHKVYKVIPDEKGPDEKGEESGWVRIVDETGEDYLYSAKHFVPVQIPKEAEQSFDLAVAL